MKKENLIIALAAGAGVAAVAYTLLSKNIPKGAKTVQPFNISRYLGKWHEIARMPSFIETDLKQLTEDYAVNGDGTFSVITKAYNFKKNEWKQASGKIKFSGSPDTGMLKVSYFGPFYVAYNVLDVDADYQYALVSGSGLSYLWILSRTTTVPEPIKKRFLDKAADIGFDINQLEWV